MSVVVNDFSISVATVNGSGSASSNTILAKSIFRMGVPVAPKNYFPSNIAGLPTWYVIRVSEKGYQARSGTREVVFALNAATFADDVASVVSGGVLFVDEGMPAALKIEREDITIFRVPFAKIAKDFAPDPRLRKLLANMVYVGVAIEMLGLDHEVVMQVVADQFSSKPKVVKLNQDVVDAGRAYARENFDREQCVYRVETRDKTAGKLFIEGNTASAMGCLMGGCTFVGWYPITPSSSLCETFISLAREHRKDPETGKRTFAALQAEDELASLGLVLGASWAGARSMTATAGPGISLMGEFAGFGYYAEIPAVICDIQRVGPSTGMPTRTQQCDVASCLNLSHGDTGHIVLLPAGPEELYEMAAQAFDLADRYQTPVFYLSDLDLGMNYWMSDSLPYRDEPLDRGKVLDREALVELEKQGKAFARYADVDEDGIPYRTLPGTHHEQAPYFTRGSGHTSEAEYTEDGEAYQEVVDRIKRKIEGSVRDTPAPVIGGEAGAEIGILHYGSTRYAVEEAMDVLAEQGVKVRDVRVRALPLHQEVIDFIDSCKTVYCVEQNRDGQVADIVALRAPHCATKLRKVLYYAGLPMAAEPIVQAVRSDAREPAHV